MHEITFNIGSGRPLKRSLPSSWDEVPHRQKWDLLRQIIAGRPMVNILAKMLDLPMFIFSRISREQWYDLCKAMAWTANNLPVDKPLLHYICPRKVALYFPAVNFADLTGREYALFDDMVSREESLDRILAVLCRPTAPGRPAYDKRIPLAGSDQIENWLPEVQAIPQEIQTYLHLVFAGYRAKFYESYKDWLFPASGEQSSESSGMNFGWWGAFLSIAEDGVFGSYDQVLDTNIHTICMHMIQQVDRARKLEEKVTHNSIIAKMRS